MKRARLTEAQLFIAAGHCMKNKEARRDNYNKDRKKLVFHDEKKIDLVVIDI